MSADSILRFENETLQRKYEFALDIRARSRKNEYSLEMIVYYNLSTIFESLQEFLSANIPPQATTGVSFKISIGTNYITKMVNEDINLIQDLLQDFLLKYELNFMKKLLNLREIFNILKYEIKLAIYDKNHRKSKIELIKIILINLQLELNNLTINSTQFYKDNKSLMKCFVKSNNVNKILTIIINNFTDFLNHQEFIEMIEDCLTCFESISKMIKNLKNELTFDNEFKNFNKKLNEMFEIIDFVNFNSIIEQEKALFLEIIRLSLSGHSIIKLMKKYSTNLFEKSKLTVDSFSGIVRYKFTEIYKSIINNLSKEVIQRYLKILTSFEKLTEFYSVETINSLISIFSLWRRPFISLENKNVLVSTTRNDFHVQKFNIQTLNDIVQDNVNLFTRSLKMELLIFQENLDKYIVRLKMSLDNVVDIFNSYKKKTQLDADFIKKNFLVVDVFFGELSFSKITQKRSFKIEELLGFSFLLSLYILFH